MFIHINNTYYCYYLLLIYIKAITGRKQQILATVVLGFVTIYIYAVLGFAFFQGRWGWYW